MEEGRVSRAGGTLGGLRGAVGRADRHPLNAEGHDMGLLGPGNLPMRPPEATPLQEDGAQASCWGSECSHCGFGWFWGEQGQAWTCFPSSDTVVLGLWSHWWAGATMAYLTPMSHPFLTEAV